MCLYGNLRPPVAQSEWQRLYQCLVTLTLFHIIIFRLKSSYIVSKIALSALTRIQSRQMEAEERADIAVNHVHPGFVATDINKHMGHLSPDK